MSAARRVMRGQGAQAVLGALKKRKQIQQEQAQQEQEAQQKQEAQDVQTSPESEVVPKKVKPTLIKFEPKPDPAPQVAPNQEVIAEQGPSEQEMEQFTPEQPLSGPTQPVSKKRLLQQFLEMKGKKNLIMSMAYLPPPLDQIVGDIAHRRGKGFTRSHLFIESLLLHPDVLQELKDRELLK